MEFFLLGQKLSIDAKDAVTTAGLIASLYWNFRNERNGRRYAEQTLEKESVVRATKQLSDTVSEFRKTRGKLSALAVSSRDKNWMRREAQKWVREVGSPAFSELDAQLHGLNRNKTIKKSDWDSQPSDLWDRTIGIIDGIHAPQKELTDIKANITAASKIIDEICAFIENCIEEEIPKYKK